MAAHRNPGKAREVAFPQRGDIFLVNFDPTLDTEIRKTRPTLVIQNDVGNRYSPITIVAAITSKFDVPPFPTEVVMEPRESGLSQTSAVVLNQIRSVDRQRLAKRIGKATDGRTICPDSPTVQSEADRACVL